MKGSMSTFRLEPGICGPVSVLSAGLPLVTLCDFHPCYWLRGGHHTLPCYLLHVRQAARVISLISSKVFGDCYSTIQMATDPCNTFPLISDQRGDIAFSQAGLFVGVGPIFSLGPQDPLLSPTWKWSPTWKGCSVVFGYSPKHSRAHMVEKMCYSTFIL